MISVSEFVDLVKELLKLARTDKLNAENLDTGKSFKTKIKFEHAPNTDHSLQTLEEEQGERPLPRSGPGQLYRRYTQIFLPKPRAEDDAERDLALYCFSPEHPFRRLMVYLADHETPVGHLVNITVDACILLSTIALSAEHSFIGTGSTMHNFLRASDFIVNIAFTLEFFIKVVALGWFKYIGSAWNKMSFLIVVTSDVELILSLVPSATSAGTSVLRIFRIFRVLRPLRIAAEKFPGLMVLVRTAQMSAGPLGNTMVMSLIILAVLSIIGMQIFANKMGSCSDTTVWVKMKCTGLDEENTPRSWNAYDINFDNLINGFTSQMMLATQDDWPPHMFAAADVSGPVTGPSEGQQIWLAVIFYIFSLLTTSAVLVNTVVGIFVENYEICQDQYQQMEEGRKAEALEKSQAQAQEAQSIEQGPPLALESNQSSQEVLSGRVDDAENQNRAHDARDVDPQEGGDTGAGGVTGGPARASARNSNASAPIFVQRWEAFRVVLQTWMLSKVWFDVMISVFLFANTVTMALDSFCPSAWQSKVDETFDYFFGLIFGLEAIVKLAGMHPHRYFSNILNGFDFFIVLLSFASYGAQSAAFDPSALRLVRVLRLFRIIRIFRILKLFKGLKNIIHTLFM